MTACVNKKHSRRVAAAVSASLVGALTLGAAPAVVMAQPEAGVEQQFVSPTGAFAKAKVDEAVVRHGYAGTQTVAPLNGAIQVTFEENQPVSFESFKISLVGSATEEDDFRVDPAADDDQFEVAFYHRDSMGNKTGEEIKNDLTEVGQYCAVITGKPGTHYAKGELIIPIDITAAAFAVDFDGTTTNTDGSVDLYYDATVHDDFEFRSTASA